MKAKRGRAIGVLAFLTAITAGITGRQDPVAATEEGFVEVPAGSRESVGEIYNIGEGGRRVVAINGSSDYVTLDVWVSGRSVTHATVYPKSSVNLDYPGWFDATVTRWRDCATYCTIAGSYNFTGGTNPNYYVSPAVYYLFPRP